MASKTRGPKRGWSRDDLDVTTISHRLATMVEGMPDGAMITLPVEVIRSWLEEDGLIEPEDALIDMTVVEVAERLNRSPSTVRGWCGSGALEGAYRLRGREWRIPPGRLRAFLDSEAKSRGGRMRPRAEEDIDLGAWRRI